jgi:hypothetical protein
MVENQKAPKVSALQQIEKLERDRAELLEAAREEMRKIKRARRVSSDQLVQAIISVSRMWMEAPKQIRTEEQVTDLIETSRKRHVSAGDPQELAGAVEALGVLLQLPLPAAEEAEPQGRPRQGRKSRSIGPGSRR